MNKYIKLFLFIFIMLFTPKVFATDYNVSSKIKPTTSGATGKYYGLEIYNSGTNNLYNVGTRYNGRLSKIEFYVNTNDFDWNYNKTYTITLNMSTDDWRNNFMGPIVMSSNLDGTIPSSSTNMYVSNSFQFISMKKIKFNFKISSSLGPYIKFTIYSTNVSSNYITGVSNWQLSSIIISDLSSSSVTPTPAPVYTPTPTPSSATNNDVINANNQNTENIINNQNQNTQDIIDSNSSNTTDIIDNANANAELINDSLNSTCKNGLQTFNESYNFDLLYDLNSGGELVRSTSYKTSPYFVIKPNSVYSINVHSNNSRYVCFYRANKQFISCSSTNGYPTDITAPNTAYYMRASVSMQYNLDINGEICNDWEQEGVNATNQKLDDINNSINDDTTPEIDIDIDLPSTSPITNLLLMPITLMNTILNNTSNSCQPYILPFDFFGGNNTLTLPCINLKNYLGNEFYNILDAIICFFIAYEIGKFCITIYEDLLSLKDNFGEMYSPKHRSGRVAKGEMEGRY